MSAEPLAETTPAHGGELRLRGAGMVAVATDRLYAELERCHELEAVADSVLQRLRAARHVDAAGTWVAEAELAERAVARTRFLAEVLRVGIEQAAHAYDEAESLVAAGQRGVASRLATGAGLVVRMGAGVGVLALLAAPLALASALSWAAAGVLRPELGSPLEWLVRHPELVTSREFVTLVGLIAASSDDFALTALGLPPGLSHLLGDDALGVTGVAVGAALVVGGTSLVGIARETPVAVSRRSTRIGSEGAPVGSAERLRRVPDGGPQLRLERYDAPGQPPRWIVYVGPTYDFALTGGQPFDMTSNLHAVAGLSPASLRALDYALADAGVAASDEVQFVGFSQGGIIAARAASSGSWNAVGLETFGSPLGTIDLSDSVRGIAVRHSDDFVPVTGGPDAADDRVIRVEREAFLPGDVLPHIPAPAHQRSSYLTTAALLDQAESQALRAETARLDSFGADYLAAAGTLTVYEYSAVRVSDD